jgi:pyridoxamine 5'-phosphate oxidase
MDEMGSKCVVGVAVAGITAKPREKLLCDGVHERGRLACFSGVFAGKRTGVEATMSSDGAYSDDPWHWFRDSFARALASESFDASRAALATVDVRGQPSVRFVLVKQVDETGFCFFTNHGSAKGLQLAGQPAAALAFHWHSIDEQVRAEGHVERVSEAESDAYFATRPRGSQLSAWTSRQSQPIQNREALEAQRDRIEQRWADTSQIPRPPFWGGYRVIPSRIEFWRNRVDRLHDRWSFVRAADGWQRSRLQP